MASLEVKVGKLSEKKEREKKEGLWGDSGYCIWEGQGKTKREQVAMAARARRKSHASA